MFRFPLKWKGTPVLPWWEITRGWRLDAFQALFYACYLSHSSPAPDSTITQPHSLVAIIILILRMREMMFRVVKTLPRSHELGVDEAKFQSSPLLTPGGERCLWAVGTELCWKQWKAERGMAGGRGELPLFILVEVMDIWPLDQEITLELALAGNISL